MRIKVIKAKPKINIRKQRVCAYARVSTDSLEQEGSLENQVEHYRKLITANSEYEFVGVFSDQGISGYKENRPGFKLMIDEARKGNIDLIITKSISRFARNTVTVLKYVRELKSLGVGIFFELQNISTLTNEGELMLSILAAFAQAESEGASENAKMTYRRKFKQGNSLIHANRILGYDLDEYGDIVINPKQAEIVRLIYELALNGVRPSHIKNYLNNNGIKTITGKEWNDTGVFRILQNEIYKGDLRLQKTFTDTNRKARKNTGQVDSWYIEDNHPAIVTKDEWERVQAIIKERPILIKEASVSDKSNNTLSLSGMLYCSKCGAVLHHRNDKNNRAYWACSTNLKKSKKACSGIYVPEDVTKTWNLIEKLVVEEGVDEYGKKYYIYTSKAEYDRRKFGDTDKKS